MPQLTRAVIACTVLSCGCVLPTAKDPAIPAAPPPNKGAADLHDIEALLRNNNPVEAIARLQPLADKGDPSALFVLGFLQEMGVGLVLDDDQSLQSLTQAAERGHKTAAGYLAWKFEQGFLTKPDPQKAARFRELAGDAAFSSTPIPEDWLGVSGRVFIPKLARAFLWLSDAASQGDPVAQFNLAQYYFEGRCSLRDYPLHIRLLRQSADKNFGPAAFQLSRYYHLGLFTQEDSEKSNHYLHIAAEAGIPRAMYALADNLLEVGGEKTAEGLHWLELAAAKKHPEACLDFGRRLRDGNGLPKDEARALQVFQSVADAKDSNTLDEVGYAYESGTGTTRDLDHARSLYEKSAARGSTWAKYRLGMIALENPVNGKIDHPAAMRWLEAAAREENVSAMIELGKIHHYGLGVTPDPAAGFVWYERAAREGNIDAQKMVAWCLLTGTGIERDDQESFTWISLAAKKGDTQAALNVAQFYLAGQGVDKNIPAALDQVFSVLHQNPGCSFQNDAFLFIYGISAESQTQARAWLLERWNALAEKPGPTEEHFLMDLILGGPEWLRDSKAALSRLQRRSDEKELWSLERLAQVYFHGDHLPRDYKASYEYAERAAALPGPGGAAALGFHKAVGIACKQDEAGGLALLETAAVESGYANYLLAQFYTIGLAVPVDLPKARKHLVRSAELNFQSSWNLLNRAGDDPAKAIQHFASKATPQPFDEKRFAEKLAAHLATKTNSTPIPFWQCPPEYPPRLRILNQNGEAIVRFEVTPEGRTENIFVIQTTHPEFAIAAFKTIQQWRFLPSMTDGKPGQTRMQIPVIFNLQDE